MVGGALGLFLGWLRGELFVLDQTVAGYHWDSWLNNAWFVAHGHFERMDGFRKPLFGFLVGSLGESMGYADASIILSSVAVVVMIMAGGLLARVLGGPAAGGLAAFAVGASPLVQNAAHWATGYPLLAAGTALALALAAAYAVHGLRWTALAAGLATILALSVEDRGLLVLPMVLGLLALGLLRKARHWPLVLGLVVAVAAVPPAIDHSLGHRAPNALSLAEKRSIQQAVVHRWLSIERDQNLVAACTHIQADQTLQASFYTTRCAREVLRYNSRTIGPGTTLFPAAWVLICAVLWWVGGPLRGRREALAMGALAGVTWLLFAAATPMPHRYILQFAVPLAVVVPVATTRLAGMLQSGWAGWMLKLVVCLVLSGAAWLLDPYERDSITQRTRGDWSSAEWARDAQIVRDTIPDGEQYLDCSGHAVNSALLPEHLYLRRPVMNPSADLCLQWVTDRNLSGSRPRWLSVSPSQTLRAPQTREKVRIDELVAKTDGWSYVSSKLNFQLWVYQRPE
ncbi:MAG: hypothetical protein CL927_06960 [Deltaproteobacteria bacterium]|nr:hypothetical protein [Deltaproteobacteria bacterium]HCH64434.1 hypothetical protein [Deltaproteobacteria bacterium]